MENGPTNETTAIRPVPAVGTMTGMRLRLAFSSVGRCSSDLHTVVRITITPSPPMAGGVVTDSGPPSTQADHVRFDSTPDLSVLLS